MPKVTTTTYTCDRCGATLVIEHDSNAPGPDSVGWCELREHPIVVGSEYHGRDVCADCRAKFDRFMGGAELFPPEGVPFMTAEMVAAARRREAYDRSGVTGQ